MTLRRPPMSGLLQTSFYFGWSAICCYALLLMLGFVSVAACYIDLRCRHTCSTANPACVVDAMEKGPMLEIQTVPVPAAVGTPAS
jgi:hypothetical protein